MRINKIVMIITGVVAVLFFMMAACVYNSNHELYIKDQETYGCFDCILFDVPEKNIGKLNNLLVKEYGLLYSCIVSISGGTESMIISYAGEKTKGMIPIVIAEGSEPGKGEIVLSDRKA